MIRHTLHYELTALARNKRARLFTLGFPILLLVVLSASSGDASTTTGGQTVSLARFYVPGVMTFSIVTSCFAATVGIVVNRREAGIYQRRRATPVPAHLLLAAQTAATTVHAGIAAAVLLVIGRLGFGVDIGAGPLLALALALVAGALACCALGFLVAGLIPSVDTAQPVVQFAMFPVLFISGVWFSADDLPAGLRVVADALPVKHLADALHQAAGAGTFTAAFAPADLAVLLAWAAGAALLASRRFAWAPVTAAA